MPYRFVAFRLGMGRAYTFTLGYTSAIPISGMLFHINVTI